MLISKILNQIINKSSNSGDGSHGFDKASHGDYSYARGLFEVWLVAMNSFCGEEHGYGLIFLELVNYQKISLLFWFNRSRIWFERRKANLFILRLPCDESLDGSGFA